VLNRQFPVPGGHRPPGRAEQQISALPTPPQAAPSRSNRQAGSVFQGTLTRLRFQSPRIQRQHRLARSKRGQL